jgi:hypothetical protein
VFTISSVQAQRTQTTNKTKAKGEMAENGQMQSNALRDGIMMQGNKMMVIKDGKASMMTEDMALSNGTMVMKDGSVKMKDGTSMTMANGDHMDMSGTMMHGMSMNPDNSMQNSMVEPAGQSPSQEDIRVKTEKDGDMKMKGEKTKMKSTDEKAKVKGAGKDSKTKY